jgi:adenylate cyclase
VQEPNVEALVDWLVDGAPGANGPAEVVGQAGPRLRASGVAIGRIAAFVRTLHPNIMGRSFEWVNGVPGVVVKEAPYAVLRDDMYTRSPVGAVFASGTELRCRLEGPGPLAYTEATELAAKGYTDYLVLPLRFLDGQVHAVTFACDRAGGFADAELDGLRRITRPLARIAEILALRRTATNLLSAYVGRDAGERILQGMVQRGDTESIRCVVWFSDLRGFTSLSSRQEPQDIIRVLNRLFDCQVPAVDAAGGQVLKFLGDGMLAIFPIDDAHPAEAAAAAALRAAQEAFAALDKSNAGVPAADTIAFGIALHAGEVAYGNVGGIGRLDFTCIGPAVNLASRLEGLTKQVGERLVLSAEVAALLPGRTRKVGAYAVKGLEEAVEVFTVG